MSREKLSFKSFNMSATVRFWVSAGYFNTVQMVDPMKATAILPLIVDQRLQWFCSSNMWYFSRQEITRLIHCLGQGGACGITSESYAWCCLNGLMGLIAPG
jgi:hypothetical protein